MRRLFRRAIVSAGASLVLVAPTAALAGTSGTLAGPGPTVTLGWSPTTSAGTYDYGTLSVGQSAPKAFTLTNSGTAPTSPLKIGMSGSSTFTKTADTCTGTPLGPGKTCTITITFAPATSGQSYKATLTATSSKPSASASLTLTGTSPAKAAPTLSTAPGPGGPAGSTTVTDTAALSNGSSPSGTITFNLYGPSAASNCTTTPVDTEAVTVTGNGSYATPTGAKPSQAGTYWWTASYSGDANNAKAVSKCGAEKVVIGQASPAITTTASPGGTVGATTATDKATLSGGVSPTGTITFTLSGPASQATCSSAPVVDTEKVTVTGNGSYATPAGFTPAQPGTYWWTAAYGGDANNAAVSSGCGAESVTITPALATPTLTTTPSPGGPVGSTTVTDTATLSGGFNPTGTVTFSLYGPSPTPDCSPGLRVGLVTATVSGGGATGGLDSGRPSQAGTYWWTAAYGGDGNNNPVSSGCGDESVTLAPLATPTLVTTPSGDGTILSHPPIFDSADLSGGNAPTGTITFTLYGPSPTANCSNLLFMERVTVTGNGTYAGSGGPSLHLVPPGTYWWTAAYSGDNYNNPVSSGCGAEKLVISPESPAISTAPATAGSGTAGSTTVTDTATLSGGFNPTGTVTFSLYGPSPTPDCSPGLLVDTETGTVTGDGTATTPTGATPSQAGTYWWTAAYGGDGNNNPVSSGCGDESVTISP